MIFLIQLLYFWFIPTAIDCDEPSMDQEYTTSREMSEAIGTDNTAMPMN